MSELKSLSNGQIVPLLATDEVGDAGDVLTRVGAGAEFKPPSGGGGAAWGGITGTLSAQTDLQAALDAVTFDQDLNTDDAVVFGGLIVNGDVRFNDNLELADGALNIWQDSSISIELVEDSGIFFNLLRTTGGEVILGAGDYALQIQSATRFTSPVWLSEINTPVASGDQINIAPDGLLDLNPTGDLNINGTPGVTAGPFTTITGITVTKGIITALTGS